MLDRQETARRIVAARTVRGIDQLELEQLFYERGGDRKKSALGKIERGQEPLTEGGRVVLARILRVPENWFTAEDPFAMFEPQDETAALAARVDTLADQVSRIAERLAEDVAEQQTPKRSQVARRGGRGAGGSRSKAGAK